MTDKSAVGVTAILSQVQYTYEKPTAYASQHLKWPEMSYSSLKLEMLALVQTMKYFQNYLYGKQFLVRTDHSALKWLHTFANNNRLMQWNLCLAEFDVKVQYNPSR
jgi:hypothetical protein